MSLLEKKRQQWARERAEMESMRSPWGLLPPAYNMRLAESRSRYASSLEIRTTCPASSQQDLLPRRQRSPSLPPIPRCDVMHFYDVESNRGTKYQYDEAEGETSGYASEVAQRASPQNWRTGISTMECQCDTSKMDSPSWQSERDVEEAMRKQKEGERRSKWGDKGVAVGRLWEPHDGDQRLPQSGCKGPPSWVERGFAETQNIFLEQAGVEGYDPKSGMFSERFTHLLGQNIPLESSVKAERESKRLKALQLQAAIVQQLEERAQKKKAEKERRMREEIEEEERFKKQKELEIQRIQEEKQVSEEKQQREQRRTEALRIALEKAEQQAKIEKENNKMKKLRGDFGALSVYSENLPSSPKRNSQSTPLTSYNDSNLIQNIYIDQTSSPRKKLTEDEMAPSLSSETNIMMSSPQSTRNSANHDANICQQINNKKHDEQTQQNVVQNLAIPLMKNTNNTDSHLSLVPASLAHELFTPVPFSHGGVQMAFLMPQHVYQCMHPVSVQPLYSTEGHNRSITLPAPVTDSDDTCSNRVLTPSKYRNPNSRDACTQTDFDGIGNCSQKNLLKYTGRLDNDTMNLETSKGPVELQSSDEKGGSLLNKKESKMFPGEKYKDIESRPKWGANKPPTQYKKQSEKDIFYSQKRKMRTKKRIQEKQYTSHSSDENTSPSPQENKSFAKLNRNEFSICDNYWRVDKVNRLGVGSANNISVETTEVSPLKYCEKSGLVKICADSAKGNKSVRENTEPKRITLSHKFMNDKFGNPKMWTSSAQSEDKKGSQRSRERSTQRQISNDSQSKTKNETLKCQSEAESNRPVLLSQIKTLKDSLRKQQQAWGRVKSPIPKDDTDFDVE